MESAMAVSLISQGTTTFSRFFRCRESGQIKKNCSGIYLPTRKTDVSLNISFLIRAFCVIILSNFPVSRAFLSGSRWERKVSLENGPLLLLDKKSQSDWFINVIFSKLHIPLFLFTHTHTEKDNGFVAFLLSYLSSLLSLFFLAL